MSIGYQYRVGLLASMEKWSGRRFELEVLICLSRRSLLLTCG